MFTKKIVFFMVLFFLLNSYSHAADLAGYWSLDEGKGIIAKDSASGANGEILNAKWVEGKKGKALEFDGKSSYVEIKDTENSRFDLTAMTLSAWIYPKAYPKDAPVWNAGIVGKVYYTGSTYGLMLESSRQLGLRVYGPFGEGGKEKQFARWSKTLLKLNQWYYVAVTYDGTNVKFFINGRLDSVYEQTGAPYINNQSIIIGSIYKEGKCFEGIIDEVKVYKGVLTDEEVETEYKNSGGEVSSITITKTKTPPKIDGILDDACWKEAKRLSLVDYRSGKAPKAETEGYICYDENNLYFGFICKEPNIDKLKANVTNRDGKIWEDDGVEVFIDSNFDRKSYYQFVINPIGTQFDGKWNEPNKEEKGWDGIWLSKTKIDQDSWTVEMAIPFHNFDYSSNTGSSWGMNLCRDRKPEKESTILSPTGGGFHKPEMFAAIRGINIDYSFYQVNVSHPKLIYRLDKGEVNLGVSERIKNYSEKLRNFNLKITNLGAGETQTEKITLNKGEEKEVILPVKINAKSKTYRFQIELFDLSSNKPCHSSIREAEAPSLVESYLTRDYYTTEKTATLKGSLEIEGPLSPNLEAKVQIQKDGKVIIEKSIPVTQKEFEITLDITSLKDNKNQVILSLYQDKRNIFSDNLTLNKYPPSVYEIKTDKENLNVLVNDKPFFAIGLFSIPETKFAEYAKAGFNITNTYGGDRSLNTAYDNGMFSVYLAYYTSGPRNTYAKPLAEVEKIIRGGALISAIEKQKKHPAFFGWFWDEPGPEETEGCAVLYNITKEYDLYHPVFPCFWQPGGPSIPDDRYDILGNDPYWYPGKGEKIITFTNIMDNYVNTAEKIRKPLWIVPQSAGWDMESAITVEEQQCQTYLALIHEAKGIFYFDYSYTFPAMREMLKKLAGEMKQLTPVLLTKSPEQEVIGKDKTGVHLLIKEYNNKTYILSANISDDTQKNVRIIFPRIKKDAIAKVMFEDRVVSVKDGILTDEFNPYGTHVYEIERFTNDTEKPVNIITEIISSKNIPIKEQRRWPDFSHDPKNVGNPGFEIEEEGQPHVWVASCSWEEKEYCSLDTTEFYEGKKSLKITIPQPTKSRKFGRISILSVNGGGAPVIKLEKDKNYILSVYLKSDTDNFPVKIDIRQGTPWGVGKSTIVNVGTKWEKYTLSFITTKENHYVNIQTENQPGTLWIDKVEINQQN